MTDVLIEPVTFTTTPANPISWAENTAAAGVVYDANAFGLGTITYALGGTDAAIFNLNSATGVLTFKTAPNFEAPLDVAGVGSLAANNIYDITITGNDSNPSGTSFVQDVHVQVTNVNETPTFTSTPAGGGINWAENTAAANVIYDANAIDPDAGAIWTYSLSGADALLFSLDPVTGQLRFNASPDFENPLAVNPVTGGAPTNTYNVTIGVSDGVNPVQTQSVVVNVTNVLGVTINGNNAGNTINAVTTVLGQPLPTSEDDTINGLGGNDIISSFAGNDIINGGTGNDTMTGGLGNDTYVVDSTGDNVIEAANQGIDLVQASSGVIGTTFLLAANVENLTLTGATAINGTGNIGANIIIGNGANNILTGLGGADTLDGGAGTGDTASYAGSAVGVNVSLATGLGIGGDAQGDILLNIENLTGSSQNDILEGNAGNNVLNAGLGGTSDTVSYANATAGVTVSLANGAAQNTLGAGTDTLSGFENVTGSGLNDVLSGTTTANTLDGGVGADRLTGGGGADILIGGLGNDRFVYTATGDSTVAASDTISDFIHLQDLIDLSAIDANAGPGNGTFLFGGNNAAVVANSVTWFETGGNTIVQADNTGNTGADFRIVLTGINLGLTQLDFVL